jgi:hypothetical protein
MKKPITGGNGQGRPNRNTDAPKWSQRIPDRIAWCVWFLRENPGVYAAFEHRADEFRIHNPDRPISSEWIVNELRFASSVRTHGDVFSIGSNAKSLLARLYKLEHPDANIDLRRCWLSSLHPDEWQTILDAWRAQHGPVPS